MQITNIEAGLDPAYSCFTVSHKDSDIKIKQETWQLCSVDGTPPNAFICPIQTTLGIVPCQVFTAGVP